MFSDLNIHTLSIPQIYGTFESAMISCHNSTAFYVECLFHNLSTATTCVGVYWKNISNPYGLVNLNTKAFDRNGDKAHGYINVDSEGYHIAVFSFSSNKNMIIGQPLVTEFARTCCCGELLHITTII